MPLQIGDPAPDFALRDQHGRRPGCPPSPGRRRCWWPSIPTRSAACAPVS